MRTERATLGWLPLLALTLASCGGGGGGAKALPGSATSASVATAPSKIAFTIVKPATAAASSSRTPQYLPASVSSISIAVTLVNGSAPAAPSTTVANVSPTASGCATDPTNASNYVCTVRVVLPIGSDTLTVAAYDGPNATGNLISQQVPVVTVVQAQANLFAMTLDAVPGAIALVTPLPAGLICSGTPPTCTFTGLNTVTFNVTIADAHGTPVSTAVAGSPILTATSASPSVAGVTVSQQPYAVTVTPTTTGPVQLTLTATPATPGDGLTATTQLVLASTVVPAPPGIGYPLNMTLDAQGNLWVANYASNSGSFPGHVDEYAPPYTGTPAAAITASTVAPNAFQGPSGVAFDGQGNLFVCDYIANDILEFAPPYNAGPIAAFGTLPQPIQMAFDAAGRLFVATSSGVEVFAPPFSSGSVAAFTMTGSVIDPFGLQFDPSGNVWVSDATNEQIDEFAPPFGSGTTVTTHISLANPNGLAFDASGNLYVGSYPAGAVEFAAPLTNASVPAETVDASNQSYGVAIHGNDLFVSNFNAHNVTEYGLPLGSSNPVIATVQSVARNQRTNLALPRLDLGHP